MMEEDFRYLMADGASGNRSRASLYSFEVGRLNSKQGTQREDIV